MSHRPDEFRAAALSLLSAKAVRNRAHQILTKAKRGGLNHFTVHLDKLPSLAGQVADLTRRRYPDNKIPLHSRWRHFNTHDRDRWTELVVASAAWHDAGERARAAFDLVIVSVLLDAGAGPDWSYRDTTGASFVRSEGIAVATIALFAAGFFSSNRKDPLRVDADRLSRLTEEDLAAGFQVDETNPLVGLSGRTALINRLGSTVAAQPKVFSSMDMPRPGGLFDHLVSILEDHHISAEAVLRSLLIHLNSVWPDRIRFGGFNLGDTWRHSAVGADDHTNGLIPFHKLSQWLTYSLIEPLHNAEIEVTDVNDLTGLAEYRNGGLFLDAGVLQLKIRSKYNETHKVGDELVVEWRALTVALLDQLAPLVRRSLGFNETELPLGKILEGGTWALGRQLAFEQRPDDSLPLKIVSDGTVF
jgi:uncharacterized protein DUF1688